MTGHTLPAYSDDELEAASSAAPALVAIGAPPLPRGWRDCEDHLTGRQWAQTVCIGKPAGFSAWRAGSCC